MSSSPALSSSLRADLYGSSRCTSCCPHSEGDIQELLPGSSTPDLSSDSPPAGQDCSTGSEAGSSSDDDQTLSAYSTSARPAFLQREYSTSSDSFTECLDVLLLKVLKGREPGQDHGSCLPSFSCDRDDCLVDAHQDQAHYSRQGRGPRLGLGNTKVSEGVNAHIYVSYGGSYTSERSENPSSASDNRSSGCLSPSESSFRSGKGVSLPAHSAYEYSQSRLHSCASAVSGSTSGPGENSDSFSSSRSQASLNDYPTKPRSCTASQRQILRPFARFGNRAQITQHFLHTEFTNVTNHAHTSTHTGDRDCMLKAGTTNGSTHAKRSRSFFNDEVTSGEPSALMLNSVRLTSPTKKKQKRDRHARSGRSLSSAQVSNRKFAKGPASLRRALSLKSDAEYSFTPSNKENHTPIVRLNSISHSGFQHVCCVSGSPLIDTVPTTPLAPPTGGPRTLRRQSIALQRHSSCFLPPVPIIAPPPPLLIPLPPLSGEDSAKLRLKQFLGRESRMRTRDGLDVWRKALVSGKFLILTEEDVLGLDIDERQELEGQMNEIDILRRREIIEWILTVFPPVAQSIPSSETGSDTDSESELESESNVGNAELYDQLVTSPETRFHAAYLFTRYFFHVLDEGSPGHSKFGSNDETTFGELHDGLALVKWDVAVGCLALSVKYHRDCLPPLNPVFAFDFVHLAPHSISYDDFETTQRDILAAISYFLGDTPQPVLDELWLAVPTLRRLLDFKDGWDIARNETWLRLFDAVAEPDILRFPISLLAASALVEGVIASLELKYEFKAQETRWRQEYAARRWLRGSGPFPVLDNGKSDDFRMRNEHTRRTTREVEPVVEEIRHVLEIEEEDLMECRRWLCRISDSHMQH